MFRLGAFGYCPLQVRRQIRCDRCELTVDIEVYQADAFEIPADVLVLPYAQVLHGLARLAVEQIEVAAADIRNNLPIEGASLLVDTRGQMAARRVLFVGVVEFQAFGYEAIRQYAKRALASLATATPAVSHVALALHGARYGLNEAESLRAELAGIIDAIDKQKHPSGLSLITIVEIEQDRAQRLQKVLDSVFPGSLAERPAAEPRILRRRLDALRTVGLPPNVVGGRSKGVVELYLICEGSAQANAVESVNAETQPLTTDGIETFRRLVKALRSRELTLDRILTSPATSAQQSAELLVGGLSSPPPVHVLASLASDGSYAMFLTDLSGQNGRRIACIGHERTLGRLAAGLAGIRHELSFEHASVCRIDLDLRGPGHLVWFAPPSILCPA